MLATWADHIHPLAWYQEEPWGPRRPDGVTQGHALAALRPATAEHFGSPELVSDERDDTGPPLAAFDPQTSGFELAWFGYRLAEQPTDLTTPLVGALRTASRGR